MLLNKKGLSAIVATVLIIMITVVSAAVIAKFIVPFVRDGLSSSTECVRYDSYFSFDDALKYNCYYGQEYNISIKAIGTEDSENRVIGFNLVLYSDGSSKALSVKNGDPISQIKMFNSTMTSIVIPSPGETRTYHYTDGTFYTKGDIYPILKSGKICERRNDQITFSGCRRR